MSETWRVVLASGDVRDVRVEVSDDGRAWAESACGEGVGAGNGARAAVSMVARFLGVGPHTVEILAPGVPTRAELEAQLAAVTAQRDRAVESVARLRRDVDLVMGQRAASDADRDEAQVQRSEALAEIERLRAAVATARREGVAEGAAALHTVISGAVLGFASDNGIAMILRVIDAHREGRAVTLKMDLADDDAGGES